MTCHDEDCRSARLWAAARFALDAARITALEAERDAALARVAELEAVIADIEAWEAAERAACAASDGLAFCDKCGEDCMMTGLRAVLKRVPR